MTNYLLAGGGTAGHVNPLLALAEHIRNIDDSARFVILGTSEGLEATLVLQRGFELSTIERLPFPRRLGIYALRFPGKFRAAVSRVVKLIADQKIDVVVGFGGYASAPAYVAARKAKVPYVVHEANALPGMANRFAASRADAVAITFPGTPLPKATLTGMPLRSEIQVAISAADKKSARAHFGLDTSTPTLLVTGGSLGAKRLNDAISDSMATLDAAGIQVLHITGGRSELPEVSSKSLVRINYCDRMDLALSAADLAVTRAGASIVSELSAFGLPAVYVPYPIGNGEQAKNVTSIVSSGASIAVSDADFTSDYVKSVVIPLVSDTRGLSVMKRNLKKVAISNGTEKLYELILGVLSNRSSRKH